MSDDNRDQANVFNFPTLMILTAIACLVCYQTFGVNTTFAVATASTALAWFATRRDPNTTSPKLD